MPHTKTALSEFKTANGKKSLSVELTFIEKAFAKLNDYYFKAELPTPILTIQSSLRAYGHCTTYKAWDAEGSDGYYEINLGAETINRPLVNVISTLVHEMVHLYCMVNNIKDTSRSGTYHNKRFKIEAETRGLIISHHQTYGYTLTQPSEELVRFCDLNFGKDSKIELHRISYSKKIKIPGNDTNNGADGADDGRGETDKPKGSRKYLCPACKCSVRATKDVRVKCMDCDEEMINLNFKN